VPQVDPSTLVGEHLVRTPSHTDLLQAIGQQYTGEIGGGQVRSTHLVGHTRHRHRTFDELA
jgi:hypothetical protein